MDPDDLTDEQVEQILQSKIVQKYVAYRSLTDGVNALKSDDGVMYDTFVDGVNRRVGRLKRDTVEQVIQAIIAEVEENTEFVEQVEADGDELVAEVTTANNDADNGNQH